MLNQAFTQLWIIALVLCSTHLVQAKKTLTKSQSSVQKKASEQATKKTILEDPSERTGKAIDDDAPAYISPMNVKFKLIRLERGLSRDSRVFDAPRMFVMTTTEVPDLEQMNCKSVEGTKKCFDWVGQKLSVVRESLTKESQEIGVLKVVSVYQSTIKAEVIKDDLSNGVAKKNQYKVFLEPLVVKIGDHAKLVRPRVEKKPAYRPRAPKPKKRGKYERKEYKWQL
jgi:hypothetical protein